MRTLRLSLVGTVIVVLLGLGGAVLAQDEEEAPVWVALLPQENCGLEGDPGTFEPGTASFPDRALATLVICLVSPLIR